MAWRHIVTDSRGGEHKRTSVSRRYAFAVVAHWAEKTCVDGRTWPPRTSSCWAGKRHLAEQYAAERRRSGAEAVEIIPCEPTEVKR